MIDRRAVVELLGAEMGMSGYVTRPRRRRQVIQFPMPSYLVSSSPRLTD